jgi:hypothetical protein
MKSRRTKFSVAAAVVALVLVVTAVYIRSTASAKSETGLKPALVAAASAAITAQGDSGLTVERVTIFPYGFEPETLTRPPGPFLLTIDNRAGADDFSFLLVSDQNQPVHRDAIPRGNSSTHKELTLSPGKYVLTETSHPEWVCTITIRSN